MHKIMDLLPTGEANAISAKQLTDLCGYRYTRDLQKAIEALRLDGEIIASTCQNGGGYFIPSTDLELRQYVQTVRNRALNSLRSVSGAYKQLKASSHLAE